MNQAPDDLIAPKTIGVEIELLAPVGSDRKQLALAIADAIGGRIEAFFHLDSEPSKVKGKPIFYHLTQAYKVYDASGNPLLSCVDDITLQETLEKSKQAKPGWYRILSDDVRLLRLITQQSNASDPIDSVLGRVASLFGVAAEAAAGGVYRVTDETGASIALAAPLPGERERPCEVVTSLLPSNKTDCIGDYLKIADQLSFSLPKEGATHLHFDGVAFDNSLAFVHVARFLHEYRLVLRRLLGTNLNCRRLGDWPHDFISILQEPDLERLGWDDLKLRLANTKINKYCDFNVRNLIFPTPNKHTLEVRILPSTLDGEYVQRAIRLFMAVFQYVSTQGSLGYQPMKLPEVSSMHLLLEKLDLTIADRAIWEETFNRNYEASTLVQESVES